MSHKFPCNSCGAYLVFTPGTDKLVCPYCSSENDIPQDEQASVEEHDFYATLKQMENDPPADAVETIQELDCTACAAQFSVGADDTAGECPYCATPFVNQAHTEVCLKPQALLPFKLEKKAAGENLREWIKARWFAPNDLKVIAQQGKTQGIYLSHWTYDTFAVTDYSGSRGEYYYVTEHYTDSEGKSRTRQVRKTRWWPASGTVQNSFNDILIVANNSLPRKYTKELEPWDLPGLVPYSPEYLSGFTSEKYHIGLFDGFKMAQDEVEPVIKRSIRSDIGGDEQRIHNFYSDWRDITFKYILLPVWVTSYRYNEKVFNIVINARTGEVQGERPYSVIKIVLASLAAIALIAGIIYYFNQQ